MSLSLTCDCGARFEVEDTLAGQTVACPECQEPIKAPAAQRPAVRTSALALGSFICSLVGAFTVVGTVVAVILGIVAVVGILRQRDRLAGLGFASFGIIAGVLFTGLTLLAFSKAEAFGMGNWARAQALAPIVDTNGPLEVTRTAYEITRPAETWGVLTGTTKDPIVKALDNKSDLVLVDTVHYAFIDVKIESWNATLLYYQQQMLNEISPRPQFGQPAEDNPVFSKTQIVSSHEVPPAKAKSEWEFVADLTSGRQTWTMLVHLYLEGKKLYVVRCYVPKNHFQQVEPDFRKALESFKPKS